MSARIILFMLCIACAVYTGFVYCKGDLKHSEPDAAAISGMNVWQEKNCQSCHQIYGLGGYMGPDLTNVAAKGDAYMRAFMQSGTARMPDFRLSDKQIHELTAFLQWVNHSGHTKIPDSAVHWTGSYSLSQ